MANATKTRKAMMNRTESLRLTRLAVEEELQLTGPAIDQYLYTSRPFSAGPLSKPVIVYKRSNKSLSLALPHLLQDFKKYCLPIYFKTLGVKLEVLTQEQASLRLNELEYCVSPAGRRAILAALAVFFRRTGAGHRIIHPAGVRQGFYIDCTVSHYAMVACFVRHALEVAAGSRKAKRCGTEKGTYFQWCSELTPVDNYLDNDMNIHQGLRLVDGVDMCLTLTITAGVTEQNDSSCDSSDSSNEELAGRSAGEDGRSSSAVHGGGIERSPADEVCSTGDVGTAESSGELVAVGDGAEEEAPGGDDAGESSSGPPSAEEG